ncbi:MAG: B12-binding domain-containing radical SAM protein [Syntrophobacteraceae bacterium]
MCAVLIVNNFGYFPTMPPFSTSHVVGMLRENGMKLDHLDINIELWDTLLSEEFIERMELRRENCIGPELPFCAPVTEKTFQVLKENVVDNISAAKRAMRRKEEYYSLEKLNWAANIIFQAQQVIYYHYGTFIHNKVIFWPVIGFNVNSIRTIYELSCNEKCNPFIDLIKSKIIPKIKSLSPAIVGLDIIFPWEVVQAVTLNSLIKKHLPGTHINFIGHGFDEFCFARLKDRIERDRRLLLGFDSIFLVRNDEELLRLYLEKDYSVPVLNTIKSLAFEAGDRVVVKGPFEEGKVSFDTMPDYSDLPLEKYYAPELVIADKLSNKCFWSRCAYCNINTYKKHRQEIRLDNFIERIKRYQEDYHCRHLFLLDEAATPKLAREFSRKIMEHKLDLIWSLRTRVDHRYDRGLLEEMHSAGCRELWIGLETVSKQLLKRINKTDDPSSYAHIAKTIMKDCNEIGIGLHFCLMLGFPMENDADRRLVFDFFAETQKFIKNIPFFVTYNQFSLNVDSHMYRNYRDFSIKEIIEDEDNFNMINTPYIAESNNESTLAELENKLNNFTEELTAVLVKSKLRTLLWFFAADSSWELLLKSRFSSGNPFQTMPTSLEKILLHTYSRIERIPALLKLWNLIVNRRYMHAESQLYR